MSHDPGLFPEPDEQSRQHLEELGRVLNKISPLRSKHRADLAYAIRDLSRSLTEERDGRPREYMGEPRSASAYLRYFLPWNLYRLTRLFQGMNLNVPEGATIIDLGAGPLTAMLALWISRPHLRTKKLTFVCMDRTPKPMKTGLEIFRKLDPESPWKVSLVKGGVHTKLRERADLLIAANTLNELDWKGGEAIYEQIGKTARNLTQRLAPGGRILLIEPGVRDAARILTLFREELMEAGFRPLAPCPHTVECPMSGEANKPWCHFRFEALSAPSWLKKLTAEARLTKQAASLSFVYFAPDDRDPHDEDGYDEAAKPIRVISQPFKVPEGQGQYGCSERGLVMLGYRPGMNTLAPGATLAPRWPREPATDEKSGALIHPVGSPARKPGPTADPSGTRQHGPRKDSKGGSPKPYKSGKSGKPYKKK